MKLGLGLSLFAAGALVSAALIKGEQERKKMQEEELRKLDEEMPEPTAVKATVIKKLCGVGDYSRVLFPSSKAEYAVLFLTDGGENIALEVGEEDYLGMSEGSRGLLVYTNKRFMAFDTDTDTDAEAE